MARSKAHSGVIASIAGFAVSILATLAMALHFCAWMFIYVLAGILWLAGLGWLYSDREGYKEQHAKSADAARWLFGIAAFVLVVGAAYLMLYSWNYITLAPDKTLTKDQTHALLTAHINFGYVQLVALVLLAASRLFAVVELQNRTGKKATVAALILMLAIVVVMSAQYTTALNEKDLANSEDTNNAFFKSKLDGQFKDVYANPTFMALPAIYELMFVFAYYLAHQRFSTGELKPRAIKE